MKWPANLPQSWISSVGLILCLLLCMTRHRPINKSEDPVYDLALRSQHLLYTTFLNKGWARVPSAIQDQTNPSSTFTRATQLQSYYSWQTMLRLILALCPQTATRAKMVNIQLARLIQLAQKSQLVWTPQLTFQQQAQPAAFINTWTQHLAQHWSTHRWQHSCKCILMDLGYGCSNLDGSMIHSMIFPHINYCITSGPFTGVTILKPVASLYKKALTISHEKPLLYHHCNIL